MGTLSAKARAKLKPKQFGLPDKARTKKARMKSGNYPMPDADHAVSALGRAKRQRKKGNLSKQDFRRIERKAKKILKQA